uniref:Uncharacterized protein n=1 Tax=Bovine ephemeral fever virus TaxID=11303 RepID=A0A5B9BHR9_BEFV|nr:putative protein P' [Bovine ephemeral fever virus]QED88215.1 putative protein P' [Bovine ephemeral fever virus]QED88226.1 putative protein P' [Bovine ephemeral fever virus]QED88237.1 putative protein P' [Bovine ephemeral fever virus]
MLPLNYRGMMNLKMMFMEGAMCNQKTLLMILMIKKGMMFRSHRVVL